MLCLRLRSGGGDNKFAPLPFLSDDRIDTADSNLQRSHRPDRVESAHTHSDLLPCGTAQRRHTTGRWLDWLTECVLLRHRRVAPQSLCCGRLGLSLSLSLSLSLCLCLCLCLCLSGFEALVVNHPTGVMNMRSNPSLPPVNVTITFTGTMPTRVSVRRVDATHANALPAYQASECCCQVTSVCASVLCLCLVPLSQTEAQSQR